ncbi:MAG: CDP-diacylglycerol--serine O-phosphatidyltransferase, partial [Elusimicrobia bacterium RIFCSPLOWO2_01_FULL_54_10]
MLSGIMVLPSLITAVNMALGVYGLTASIEEHWATAAWCTIASVFVDMLDGRVARWTRTTSKFGVEFDSYADWISFGIAPAVMVYLLVLKDHGRIGLAICFLYVLCAAVRLARFNLKSLEGEESAPYFVGLPSPAAGGILASFVILYDIWAEEKRVRTIKILMKQIPLFFHLLPGIVFILSILMVSSFRYSTFKKMNLVKPRSVRTFLVLVMGCLMIYMFPQNTIFIMFALYILSGFLEFFWRVYR